MPQSTSSSPSEECLTTPVCHNCHNAIRVWSSLGMLLYHFSFPGLPLPFGSVLSPSASTSERRRPWRLAEIEAQGFSCFGVFLRHRRVGHFPLFSFSPLPNWPCAKKKPLLEFVAEHPALVVCLPSISSSALLSVSVTLGERKKAAACFLR